MAQQDDREPPPALSVSHPITGDERVHPGDVQRDGEPDEDQDVGAGGVGVAGMAGRARGPSVSSCRCRGVIDITAAMQPWAAMTARRASTARGEARMARRP